MCSKKSKRNIIPYNYIGFKRNINTELNNLTYMIHILQTFLPSAIYPNSRLWSTLINKWIKTEIYKDHLLKAYTNNLEKDKQYEKQYMNSIQMAL